MTPEDDKDMNDGGPAFPGGISATSKPSDDAEPTQIGMTLRDYFAAQAVNGLMATLIDGMQATPKAIAEQGYAVADAMIVQRATNQPPLNE